MTRERCKPNTQEVFMDIIAQHKHMHGPLDQDKDIHKVRQTGSKTNTHTDIKGKTPNPSEAFMEGKTQMFYKCASNILKYSMKEHTIPFRISFCRLGKKEQFAACCRHQGYDTGASEMPWLLTLRTRNLRERCPEAGHLCPIWDELANEKAPWGDEVAGWQRAQVGQWVVGGGSTMVGCWDPWGPIDHLATAGACRAVSQPTPISILPHFHQHTCTH